MPTGEDGQVPFVSAESTFNRPLDEPKRQVGGSEVDLNVGGQRPAGFAVTAGNAECHQANFQSHHPAGRPPQSRKPLPVKTATRRKPARPVLR